MSGFEPGTVRVELDICPLKIDNGTGFSSSNVVSLHQNCSTNNPYSLIHSQNNSLKKNEKRQRLEPSKRNCPHEDESSKKTCTLILCRSQWPRGLRHRSAAAARLLRLWVRIPPEAWMFVCYECCVLSGRGLYDELITRPEESYRLWCDVLCDLETS